MGAGSQAVVDAAAKGGEPLLTFALAVATAVILLLLAIVGMLVRRQTKARERYEALLEKRLSDGATTMRALKDEIQQLGATFMTQLGRTVTEERFSSYCQGHETEHTDLEHRLESVKDLHQDMRETVAELRASMGALNRILARLVELGKLDIPLPCGSES